MIKYKRLFDCSLILESLASLNSDTLQFFHVPKQDIIH